MSSNLSVSLVVTSPTLDVAALARLLGLPPARSWQMGERIATTLLTRKHHGWVLESSAEPQAPLEDHLQSLLGQVASDALESVRSGGTCEVEIACVVRFVDEFPVLCVPAPLLARIAAIGAGLDIDIIPV